MSVDEQIVPSKGRHSLKVYMKKKPKKWGYKIWVLAGQSGYVYKFYISGDNTVESHVTDADPAIGKSGAVVRCKNPDCNRRTKFFCVKWKVYLCIDKHSDCFHDYHITSD